MRIVFFLKYGTLAASTRYRFLQFLPLLEEAGIEYKINYLLDNNYLEHRLKNKKIPLFIVFKSYIQRFFQLLNLKKGDIPVIYLELFPYIPFPFEKILKLLGFQYIYDFDDAVFHQYDSHHSKIIRLILGMKIKNILKHAKTIFAGNQYLLNYAGQVNQNRFLMPTVVDMNRYSEKKWGNKSYTKETPFIVGWIGSPSTAPFIYEISSAIIELQKNIPSKLMIIGAGENFSIPGVAIENVSWSENTEIENLHKFDVGIMPLREKTNWDKGKCAFKLIQYMACGIPVIGSNIGANKDVVDHEKNGFLANNNADWGKAFELIYKDREGSIQMGARARKKIQENFSRNAIAQKWLSNLIH